MVGSFRTAFDDYFGKIAEANQLTLKPNDDNALKLIKLRRELSQKMAGLQHALTRATKHPQPDDKLAGLLSTVRCFPSERGAISRHQVKWTAATMARDRDGYEADCRKLLQMHQDNHRCRMCTLLPALER
jgi:hypothetical protein